MRINKGDQIYKVNIEKGILTATTIDNTVIKLTRTRRNLLCGYNAPDYEQLIIKEFGNKHILHPEFHVIKNGVNTYTKRK